VCLSEAFGTHENSLQATVKEIVYAGAVSTYLLAGADGTPIKIQMQNRDAIPASPGESVTLRWSPAHTVVIQD
jgi:putative spermidine/putrescine transport system ATP-binding protein/spermidine/putrescine transport system ATP-binding protein